VSDLLSRIDSSPGCTIKDSFASLDLSTEGFRVLFDAQWIMSQTPPTKAWSVPSDWTEITDPVGLRLWEEAWCQEDGPRGLFRPGLLSKPVVVLGRIANGRVVAGGVVNRSAGAAGISNVFAQAGRGPETWTALAQCARKFFPDIPLIGYERGEQLADAQDSGFQAVGSLRVWIADS
jgi:hypothetical protein